MFKIQVRTAVRKNVEKCVGFFFPSEFINKERELFFFFLILDKYSRFSALEGFSN